MVVNADEGKGGTWAGAVEQLDKLHFVPVYVRSKGTASTALQALVRRGAAPWSEPETAAALRDALAASPTPRKSAPEQGQLTFRSAKEQGLAYEAEPCAADASPLEFANSAIDAAKIPEASIAAGRAGSEHAPSRAFPPAEELFAAVQRLLEPHLLQPRTETEVAVVLGVANTQARAWLLRLVRDGVVKRHKRPVRYQLVSTGAPLLRRLD